MSLRTPLLTKEACVKPVYSIAAAIITEDHHKIAYDGVPHPFRMSSLSLTYLMSPTPTSGTDSQTGRFIQSCGKTDKRGPDKQVLCPPRSYLLSGEGSSGSSGTSGAGSSDLSIFLISLPVIYKSSSGRYRCDVFEVDSHALCQTQIGVYPLFDQMLDHGPPMKQKTDVGHAQDRAAPFLPR